MPNNHRAQAYYFSMAKLMEVESDKSLYLPYVIENRMHKLVDVLNSILASRAKHSLDIASAYFSVGGYKLLCENLKKLRSFRLLLGFEPGIAGDVGLKQNLRHDLEKELYSEETVQLIEDLITYLRRPEVVVRLYEEGFLHAKCYLFYGDKGGQLPLFERLLPLIGIVGHRTSPPLV